MRVGRRRSRMHRSYQPLKPVTNRYLQQRWDQNHHEDHRRKVVLALPVVDTKGLKTPPHIQLKLKAKQRQDERLSIISRDNRLLAAKLADIVSSKGLVDHRNQYHLRSLNADRRREELHLVSHQNHAMYQRITSRQSEYRRQLWLDDWQGAERRLENVTRYPRGPTEKEKLRSYRKVKFAAEGFDEPSTSCSNTDTDQTVRGTGTRTTPTKRHTRQC